MSKEQLAATETPLPSLGMALVSIVTLVGLLGLAYYLFGDDTD